MPAFLSLFETSSLILSNFCIKKISLDKFLEKVCSAASDFLILFGFTGLVCMPLTIW
jgi:hypothetical protein